MVNKFKPIERRAQIMLINGSKLFLKGRPKNYLPDDSIKQISDLYLNWEEVEGISKIITTAEAAKNDYNLSPSRYVALDSADDTLPLEDAVEMIKENSTITLKELAEETGLSIKGVKWNVKKLKTENMLKQIGPAKGGYWEVIEDEN